MLLNATAPGVLAREAAALGATLLHYSTDYVFDGSGTEARNEDAPTAGANIYRAEDSRRASLTNQGSDTTATLVAGTTCALSSASWATSAAFSRYVRDHSA